MEETKPYMVEQVIKYSDGTETVIKYRGVIVDGVLVNEVIPETTEPIAEETIETPEIVEETIPESVEESEVLPTE